ncbi:ABC transporter permease [Cellulomonas endometrii]|jgi:AI-2 transport system permease protein|uniref:ABC transporter permease n=1 Tax=Cellulomonas endometrii TaxID=3036301 RepID=UPI0024AD64FB|nr:ABC transporter permease [Cellulomonas endometrii]
MNVLSLLKARESVTIVGALVFIALVGLAEPRFVQFENLTRVANSTVILALLAAGVAVVIITRNIDVSVGSTMALTGIVGGLLLRDGLPPVVVVPLVILLGAGLGAVNGLGVTVGRVPSIVMTLGTLGAYRGISFMITGGRSVEDVPVSYKQLGTSKALGIPVIVWAAAALLVVLMVAMARTRVGRHLYATGDNAAGAHLIGIRTTGVVVLAFAFSGAMAATAALVFLAQIGSVSNQAGMGIEMRAIAAAVIGGVALSGGVGTILGATFGAVFITTATSSLSFLGIPGFWSDTVIGAILLVALFADARVRAGLERRRLAARYRGSAVPPGAGPTTPASVAAAEGVQTTGGAS